MPTCEKQEKKINNMPLLVYGTSNFNAKYGGLEAAMYLNIILADPRPVDMYVIECGKPGPGDLCRQTFRRAGYFL